MMHQASLNTITSCGCSSTSSGRELENVEQNTSVDVG